MSGDASTAHLLARLAVAEERLRRAVARRRATDPSPDDPFRGLYLSGEAVEWLLGGPREPEDADPAGHPLLRAAETAADGAEDRGEVVRLRALARGFALDALDVDLLLIALAPDLDRRFEQLYGYLNDDVTRRRAAVGMALLLCGLSEASALGRARLSPDGPLAASGLLVVDDAERPALSRSLRVPDRVTAHLLGDDTPDPALADILTEPPPPVADPAGVTLAAALRRGVRLVYLRERPGGSGPALAVDVLRRAGLGAVCVDAGRAVADPDPVAVARSLVREARLTGAALVVDAVEPLADTAPRTLRVLASAAVPVLLAGTRGWDPGWASRPPLQVDVVATAPEERAAAWRDALGDRLDDGVDPAGRTAHFLLTPPQIVRAARAATLQAELSGEAVGTDHLRRGAREQNAAGLERLARRITPEVGWADLVLPPSALDLLGQLTSRARHRDVVLDRWRMRPGGGRGRGLTALFTGDPGTGKTMSAEVVAGDLGLDLYTVNLATVVDKYVGETEKNLERIFTEASSVNGVLLFDEADAIFGKRSEVRDAHDRYANIESAYLLQRMESFDGLAILSTNLRSNLDEAFTRRLDIVVDFPAPDEPLRRRLWDACLGQAAPRGDDVDLAYCAGAFDLTGGGIRSAAVTAAYLAAEAARPISMTDLVAAVATEYRKLGRLCLEREFGSYLELPA